MTQIYYGFLFLGLSSSRYDQRYKLFIVDYRSSHQRFSVKKLFLIILQNSHENICARVSFLIKLQTSGLKKRLWHRRFLVNFVKFLRTLLRTAQTPGTSGRLSHKFNPFQPNGQILYPMKTSANPWFSNVFKGFQGIEHWVEMGRH